MIDAAARTLDLEYFIFRQDETGQLLADALLRAADRGVRVRLLVDDAETHDADDEARGVERASEHPRPDLQPFTYRGRIPLFRDLDFAFDASRLDYRMHNKLMVVDNAMALVGGRNIGDNISRSTRTRNSATTMSSLPVLSSRTCRGHSTNSGTATSPSRLRHFRAKGPPLGRWTAYRATLDEHRRALKADGIAYARRIATGEPLAGMLSGRLPLVWAHAEVVCDSPDKRRVEHGEMGGNLMHREVAHAARSVQSELLIVTPFFVPGTAGMRLLADLRKRGVRVRVLTNSLESTPELIAQSGYMHYRRPLLEDGVELSEVRAQLGNARGSGETRQMLTTAITRCTPSCSCSTASGCTWAR